MLDLRVGDCIELAKGLDDNTIDCTVTSPPYNVSKDYDENLSLNEYLNLMKDVFSEVYRVLTPGGRAIINVANQTSFYISYIL